MRVFVYIATTQGPVLIRKITQEEEGVQSVVCLNHGLDRMPISSRYHDFVKKGTGVIHRDFDHGAFRVDLSGPVTQGDSWQLALYLAHAMAAENLLLNADSAENPEPACNDVVIWATGAVKTDLSISAVDKVDLKLQLSLPLFQYCIERKVKLLTLIPEKDDVQLNDQFWQSFGLTDKSIGFKAIAHMNQARLAIQCLVPQSAQAAAATKEPETTEPQKPDSRKKSPQNIQDNKNRLSWPLLLGSLIVGVVIFTWLQSRPDLPPGAKPDPLAIDDFGGKPATGFKQDGDKNNLIKDAATAVVAAGDKLLQKGAQGVDVVQNALARPSQVAPDRSDITLTLYRSENGANCQQTLISQYAAVGGSFPAVSMNNLCRIIIERPALQKQGMSDDPSDDQPLFNALAVVALDIAQLLDLKETPTGWEVPLPKQSGNRRLAIIAARTDTPMRFQGELKTQLKRLSLSGDKPLTQAGLESSINTDYPYSLFGLQLREMD